MPDTDGGGLVTKWCLLLATPWTVAHQASLPIGFPRQEYWSRLPFPSPRDLPHPGIQPGCPALQTDSLLSYQGPVKTIMITTSIFCCSVAHCVRFFATLWTAECQTSLSFTIFPEFAQPHVHRVDSANQPSHPLLPPSTPA